MSHALSIAIGRLGLFFELELDAYESGGENWPPEASIGKPLEH
jgi:hypothetical protein